MDVMMVTVIIITIIISTAACCFHPPPKARRPYRIRVDVSCMFCLRVLLLKVFLVYSVIRSYNILIHQVKKTTLPLEMGEIIKQEKPNKQTVLLCCILSLIKKETKQLFFAYYLRAIGHPMDKTQTQKLNFTTK